jgi:4-alpha-glucanotransferase
MTPLHELATELGVELAWRGVDGRTHVVGDDTVRAICRELGADVSRVEDARDALRAVRDAKAAAGMEPVAVAWDGAPARFVAYVRPNQLDRSFEVTVARDDGATQAWDHSQCIVRVLPGGAVADRVRLHIELPGGLPAGAHHVYIDGIGLHTHATLLAAPSRPTGADATHRWGVFAPAYSLHDRVRPSAGDFGSLHRFAQWAHQRGAALVGTLPVLATFTGHGDEPRDPSPYAPVSRRFWNETYLDVHAIDPTLEPDARMPPQGPYVDLTELAARTRVHLEPLAARATADPAFGSWLKDRADVTAYAEFRARAEGRGPDAIHYHEFVQWCCDRQLAALADGLGGRGQSLYFDFPIGTHRDGFDVYHEGGLFVRDASVGAPPDAFYASGQNWGFPPIDPRAARRDGYAYFRSCLEAHLRFARVLRIDHVMALHRLWFIPPGADASEGAYVRYAGEEQWAALCLLAARYGATIVGENLGTVPDVTNRALRDHGALGMWVLPFETPNDAPPSEPTRDELACVETHDLPPFAAWWQTLEPARRHRVVDALRAAGALTDVAEPDAATALGAIYTWLGASDALIVLATLEDLWLETEPQNRPGTPSDENFRHRGTYGFDELDDRVDADRLLLLLADARAHARSNVTT